MHRTVLWRFALGSLVAGAVVACDSDTTTAPAAASMEAAAATTTSGGAGLAAAVQPTVRVLGPGGSPVAGVLVTFQVTQGFGSSVEFANVRTDASGIASAGDWIMGNLPGTNTLVATADGVQPVTFTATVVAGAPAVVSAASGNNQSADPGTAVAQSLQARVTDVFGTIVPNATVTFTVASGGGTIAGGTSATAVTNASGIATISPWVLGPTFGANTLSATAGTGSFTFAATGLGPCDVTPPLITTGSTTNATLTANDPNNQCAVNGVLRDLYRLQVTAGQPVLITMTAGFGTQVDLQIGQGTTSVPLGTASGSPTAVRFFPATSGTIVIVAGASGAAGAGAYTLQVASTDFAVTSCSPVNVVQPGGIIAVAQEASSTDCSVGGLPPLAATYPADVFVVYLTAGQTLRLIQTPTTDLDAAILVTNPAGARTARDVGFDGGAENFIYTAAVTGFHTIHMTSYGMMFDDAWGHEFGPYLLTIGGP